MRRKKVFAHVIKRHYRPEVSACLDCGSRLRRVVTLSQRTVITLSQVIKAVHRGYRCPKEECSGRTRL